jgi:hypothetical protein
VQMAFVRAARSICSWRASRQSIAAGPRLANDFVARPSRRFDAGSASFIAVTSTPCFAMRRPSRSGPTGSPSSRKGRKDSGSVERAPREFAGTARTLPSSSSARGPSRSPSRRPGPVPRRPVADPEHLPSVAKRMSLTPQPWSRSSLIVSLLAVWLVLGGRGAEARGDPGSEAVRRADVRHGRCSVVES